MAQENTLLGKRFILPGQCPICGQAVVATITQTVEEGEIDMVDQIEMTCSTEPAGWDSPEMDEFMRSHFSTPYIDWAPIQDSVTLAINKKVMAGYGLEYDPELETWFDRSGEPSQAAERFTN